MNSDSDELVVEGVSDEIAATDLTDAMKFTFEAMIRIRMEFAELGMEIDVPKTIVVGHRRYSIEILKKKEMGNDH